MSACILELLAIRIEGIVYDAIFGGETAACEVVKTRLREVQLVREGLHRDVQMA